MNKLVLQCLYIAIVANQGLACTREAITTLKDNDIEVHDDFAHNTTGIELKCPSSALVFLIGSSEAASTVEEWNIAEPSKEDVDTHGQASANKFQAAVQKAKTDLTASFAKDPKCKTPFELVFASIIDGPGSLDSSIETVSYGMKIKEGTTAASWKKIKTKQWTLSDKNLVPFEAAFELNMAKDVGVITQILAKNTFASIVTSKNLTIGDAIFSAQIHYVLKTHGARVATDAQYQPSLENMKAFPRQEIVKTQWQSAILMDTHGPEVRTASSVFSAHWNPEDIKAVMSSYTAGDGSSNTAGDGHMGTNTAGEIYNDTAGEPGMTSGTKSLTFQDNLIAGGERTYLGKRVLGSFATYAGNGEASIGEESQLILPAGNGQNPSKNLLILDSCYASEKILGALEYAPGVAGKTVVLASVNELYFEFFDYSKLDLAGFLKMPVLLERIKNSTNLTADEKKLLANMTKGSLNWQNGTTSSAFKELAIWID